MRIEEKIARLLKARKATLSVAESCSGGLLADRLTNIPGSSDYFWLGLVTYHNKAKMKFLKIPASVLQQHGAVSEEVAVRMAKGVRRLLKTDFGIGITGIAGPGGGSKNKPVGLTFIAVAASPKTCCVQYRFKGRRRKIKQQAATQALQLLLKFLS